MDEISIREERHRNALVAPLSIYAVFHPRSDRARKLFDSLHNWFRLKHGQSVGEEVEAGLPIWLRVEHSESETGRNRLMPPIDWDEARLNVLILLIDDHLVVDPMWRKTLSDLQEEVASHGEPTSEFEPTIILPVAVDDSAWRLEFVFAKRTALPAGSPDEDVASRCRKLRRSATELITRALRQRVMASTVTDPPEESSMAPRIAGARRNGQLERPNRDADRLEVFLSHAKRDGVPLALAIREGLAGLSQLHPWFDAHELPWGQQWRLPIQAAAERGTAALIAVLTDAYPSRPWCRHEASLARMPRRRDRDDFTISTWFVQPAVVVARGGGGWSRPIPQLAQVPHMSFDAPAHESAGGDRALATRTENVVDRLLLEILLGTFYRGYADAIEKILPKPDDGTFLVLLTWVPDAWSLTQLWIALRTLTEDWLTDSPGFEGSLRWVIAYPGHGLRTLERIELEELFSGLLQGAPRKSEGYFVPHERLSSLDFDELERGTAASQRLPGLRVALSASGRDADVQSAGIGRLHIDDLTVRVTRRLIEEGSTVCYGGTLSQPEDQSNVTRSLIDVARGWTSSRADLEATKTLHDHDWQALDHPPLINYVHAYNLHPPSLELRASLAGVCGFEMLPEPQKQVDGMATRRARALTAMREKVSRDCAARVALGGGLSKWSGLLPGIAEEVATTIKAGRIPIVLGAFGGCAGLLGRYLLDKKAEWPERLTFEWAVQNNPNFTALVSRSDASAKRRFTNLEKTIRSFRDRLHSSRGQDETQRVRRWLLELLTLARPAEVIDRVLRVLEVISARQSANSELSTPTLDELLPRSLFG